MMRTARTRALTACGVLAACFTVFSGRLVYLQITKHDEFLALATEKHGKKEITYGRRGRILDINGESLAENDPVRTVVGDGSLINQPDALSEVLAGPLDLEEISLKEKLSSGRKYIVLKKGVSEADVAKIENRLAVRSLRGITFAQDSDRIYPNGSMLCHVIGFMNNEHQGVQGIEAQMDDYLRGHDGFRYTERDRTGKELVAYRGLERAPRDGCDVTLTIDLNIQNIVESELDAACAEYHPKKAIVILMRPQTGEILALANRPNFDPNAIRTQSASYLQEHQADLKDCAVADEMEPGSTFKMVTAAGAFNERLVHPDTSIFCENGYFAYGRLHDHHPYGDLTVSDILVKSSNIGAAKLAMQLGEQRLYQYIRQFGFGERTGVALPGEIPGLVYPPYKWSKLSITHIPMGQEVAVTPLQTITALSAIANGGHLMMPQIVHEITDEKGAVMASFPPVQVRQVVSRETASEVTEALKGVVSPRGTAALAKVPGFDEAGKTGTAEKIDPKGGYMPGKYIVSFCGFLPTENPAFVGLVMLDDAQVKPDLNYGGTVAGPIFARIGQRVARYLNLEPEPEPETPGSNNVIITQRDHL